MLDFSPLKDSSTTGYLNSRAENLCVIDLSALPANRHGQRPKLKHWLELLLWITGGGEGRSLYLNIDEILHYIIISRYFLQIHQSPIPFFSMIVILKIIQEFLVAFHFKPLLHF